MASTLKTSFALNSIYLRPQTPYLSLKFIDDHSFELIYRNIYSFSYSLTIPIFTRINQLFRNYFSSEL